MHRPIKPPFNLCFALLVLAPGIRAAEPASLADAIGQGHVSLNLRARHEHVDQTGLRDAEALTLRTRLGFTTAALAGFKAMVEFENIASPAGDRYNQAGLNPGGAGRAVVADPEGSEVNQAWLACTSGNTTATLGRQRLVLDNARFVGDVGWRQNMQTFDALVLRNQSLDGLTLNYAYLDRIDRVFGERLAQGRWNSDSHLFNASYDGFKSGRLTAYAYLLDFANAAAQSCATYGAAFAGGTAVNPAFKVTYRAEYATQTDDRSSPLNYRADYLALEVGAAGKPGALAVGREVLGQDNGQGFRTPLATLHAFNGWADVFLATPADGLRDTYLKAAASLPAGFGLLGFYHRFEADRTGADYGDEFDLQLTRKFGRHLTGTLKYARFDHAAPALPDVSKFWVQFEFAL